MFVNEFCALLIQFRGKQSEYWSVDVDYIEYLPSRLIGRVHCREKRSECSWRIVKDGGMGVPENAEQRVVTTVILLL